MHIAAPCWLQGSLQSTVQTTAEPPSCFSGLNNFAVHHPEPTAKPRTSPHSSLQRVRDITFTSCFLSRPAMGNLQVTDEEADMLHPSQQCKETARPCWKITHSVFSQESLKILSFTRSRLCWVFASLGKPYWQGCSSRGVRKVILPLAEGRG